MEADRAVAELLAEVTLFAGLSPVELATLAARVELEHLGAGEVLFHAGDAAGSAYVLASGRLVVNVDGETVRTLGRGDLVGELALLFGEPRTATVRASRDTNLVVLRPEVFHRLLAEVPEFAISLLRSVSARLPRAATQPPAAEPARRGVVLLGPLARTPWPAVERVAERLVAALGELTVVRRYDGDARGPSTWGLVLDRLEAESHLVLLTVERWGTPWADFCRRQADRSLLVAEAGRLAGGGSHADGDELVVLRDGGTTPARPTADCRPWHLVDADRPDEGVARLARRLAGRAVGVVLSGGGARGLAHLGVIEGLAEAGVEVDRWGGTSMGALVAALHAQGRSTADAAAALRVELVQRRPFSDYQWPRHSLIRGIRAARMLDRLLGDSRIETLERSFYCVSANLDEAVEVVHRTGSLAEAVGSSMRIPGVAPPLRRADGLLVDGGVLNNLPVDVMHAEGEGPVVAVDVMRPFGQVGAGGLPGIVDTIGRAMVLGSWQKTARTRDLADIVLAPELGTLGMFDFGRFDEAVELGRRAAREAVDEMGRLVRRGG